MLPRSRPAAAMAAAASPAACARASGPRAGARLAVRTAALPADGRGDGAATYKELGMSDTRALSTSHSAVDQKNLLWASSVYNAGQLDELRKEKG